MDIQQIAPGLATLNELAAALKPTGFSSSLNKLPKTATSSLSPLAEFAYSHDIQELTYNNQETSFAYNKDDNSVALRAHSVTNISLRQETISFDLAFSAEALGLTTKDFADSSKPMVFSFSYQKTELNINYESVSRQVNTIRKPEDILKDLSSAISEVMKNQGNKSVTYMLDNEARQSLLGDPKILRLFGELVMVIAAINVQKEQGPSSDYAINISGKGKPFIDQEEKTSVEGSSLSVEINITIQPPGTTMIPESAAEVSSSPPVQVETESQG